MRRAGALLLCLLAAPAVRAEGPAAADTTAPGAATAPIPSATDTPAAEPAPSQPAATNAAETQPATAAAPDGATDAPRPELIDRKGSRTDAEKAAVSEDDYVVRLSLPTETDLEAWALPGLRIGLAYAHGWMGSFGPALPSTENAAVVHAGVRLDKHWSLAADFEYAIAAGDLTGLRWAASLLPTLHPWRGLGLSLGVGYGGYVASRTKWLVLPSSTEVATRVLGPGEKLNQCDGGGLSALARVQYLFVAGPVFASGPFVQAQSQWTRCEEDAGSNAETGLSISRVQWWTHAGGTLGWWLQWR